MITREIVQIPCTFCGGSGTVEWSSMSPADNVDIDWGEDTCMDCAGVGWDSECGYALVDHGEDIEPVTQRELDRDYAAEEATWE